MWKSAPDFLCLSLCSFLVGVCCFTHVVGRQHYPGPSFLVSLGSSWPGCKPQLQALESLESFLNRLAAETPQAGGIEKGFRYGFRGFPRALRFRGSNPYLKS